MTVRRRACGEMLVKLRRCRQDQAARQFLQSRRQAESVAERIEELRRALAAQDNAARRAILGRRAGAELGTYRRCVREAGGLLVAQAARLADERRNVESRRTRLLDAVRQSKAARAFRDRLGAQEAAKRRAGEVAEADDMHAMYAARSGRPESRT